MLQSPARMRSARRESITTSADLTVMLVSGELPMLIIDEACAAYETLL